ncbi:BrnA antitoxin family protein [Acidisoma sp. 7E03]
MQEKNTAGASGWADPDDAPELDEAFFAEADLYRQGQLVKRGRPRAAAPKVPISIRLDADLVSGLRALGPGWQSQINQALKEWLRQKT